MGQFLHKYETLTAFTEDYNGAAYHEPWVSYVNETGNERVDYNKTPEPEIYVHRDGAAPHPWTLSEFLADTEEYGNERLILYSVSAQVATWSECVNNNNKMWDASCRPERLEFVGTHPWKVRNNNGEAEFIYYNNEQYMIWPIDSYTEEDPYIWNIIDYPD